VIGDAPISEGVVNAAHVRVASYGRGMVRWLQSLVQSLTAGEVTLTASSTTTTLSDTRIGPSSHISLTPLSSSAAGALSGLYVSARGDGTATLTHASTAAVDKTFSYTVTG
jgi:hypothetical protein